MKKKKEIKFWNSTIEELAKLRKPVVSKSLANYGAYGGLGREADKPGFDYSVYHFD